MIQLRSDCLVFESPTGDLLPCSAEVMTVELLGAEANGLDPAMVKEAIAAVLHYFKAEQGRTFVTIKEFAAALERVLNALGVNARAVEVGGPPRFVEETDLRVLACSSGKAFELGFFPRLRAEVVSRLGPAPAVLCFRGLRGCVKQLTGALRWSPRCQQLNDQIVDYLRACLHSSHPAADCALVVK